MGSKILLHFSKEVLASFPLIIKGYVAKADSEILSEKMITTSNIMKSTETNSIPLEEVFSSAS